MTKISVKDKVEAVLMYENGETLRVVAKKFKTSIPLVHYWKKNKEKLLKELEWSIPNDSNQKSYDNTHHMIKEEFGTPASVTSENVDNQNVFLENKPIEIVNDQEEVENSIFNQFTVTQRTINQPLNNVQNQLGLVSTNKNSRERENNFIHQFNNVQPKFNPLFNLQEHLSTFQNQLINSKSESASSRKTSKLNQTRRFVSALSKVQQLQLQEYHSLKNVYDTQIETGEKLKDKELRIGNNSNDANSLADEIDEYNKVINGELFIKIIERLEYLETALFYQID